MAKWIDVNERLPKIPAEAPGYAKNIHVLCAFDGDRVREMIYAINAYAKTERGRQPRWEETNCKLAYSHPTHWMPLPLHPNEMKEDD